MGSNDHMGYFTWYVCVCERVLLYLLHTEYKTRYQTN